MSDLFRVRLARGHESKLDPPRRVRYEPPRALGAGIRLCRHQNEAWRPCEPEDDEPEDYDLEDYNLG